MQTLPAKTGWIWLKDGWKLFQQQAMELSRLSVAYFFLLFAIGIIPIVGQWLPILLAPIFSVIFIQACIHIEQKIPVKLNLVLPVIHSPAFKTLLKLGFLYLIATLFISVASNMVNGDTFLQAINNKQAMGFKIAKIPGAMLNTLFFALLHLLLMMAFCYAAPLIFWNNMGIKKAVFYSFFAVYKATKAFLVYSLAWTMLIIIPIFVLGFTAVAFLFNKGIIAILIMIAAPLLVVLTSLMYCSFYASYVTLFGKPH